MRKTPLKRKTPLRPRRPSKPRQTKLLETRPSGRRGIRITSEDAQWGRLVKKRDGYRCMKDNAYYGPKARGLHAAHIFSRGNPSTRHDPENGVSLCYFHHRFWAHTDPMAFHEWVRDEFLGPDRYDALRARAKRTAGVVGETL